MVDADLSGIRVIVTDADARLGLYVIRALGRAGCRVTALSAKRSGRVIGFSSRFAAERRRVGEGKYWKTLLDSLEELAPTHDVVVPVSTYSLWATIAGAHRIEGLLPSYIPRRDAFATAVDKRSTAEVAKSAGVPVPETVFEHVEADEISDLARRMEGKYPLVVKFANDRRGSAFSPGDRYEIVRTAAELETEYKRLHAIGEYPVIQECVEGDGFGFFAITDPHGEPLATFCHRRLREYPITGGPSTLCESYHDPVLIEHGTRLLKALDWRGVGMVEFKQDRKTGEYKVLEINPRFWGSLPLALTCGVNFPLYQVKLALGMDLGPQTPYPVGQKMRFFFSDLLAVREQWRAGDKWEVTKRYLGELTDWSIKDGLFDADDPKPFLSYMAMRLGR